MSYYMNNQKMMFRKRSVFEQNFSLSDIEEMIPYERAAYLILINQTIENYEQEKQKK